MFPGAYRNLHLMALDPYDLALSKLERNSQKDRDDVRFLALTVPSTSTSFRSVTRRNCAGNSVCPKEKI
jgi:hypothetical protein